MHGNYFYINTMNCMSFSPSCCAERMSCTKARDGWISENYARMVPLGVHHLVGQLGILSTPKRFVRYFYAVKRVHPPKKENCHHLLNLCNFKPVWLPLFCETQREIFWRMLATSSQRFPLTSITWIEMLQNSMGTKHLWLTAFLQNNIFCVLPKKVIQVWKDMKVSKRWEN